MKNEEMKKPSDAPTPEKVRRRLKLLLVLPVLVLPFITMGFWSLGGGTAKDVGIDANQKGNALNLNLPSANLKDDSKDDKLTFYEKASKERERNEELLRNDSMMKMLGLNSSGNELSTVIQKSPIEFNPNYGSDYNGLNTSPTVADRYNDTVERNVLRKLAQLQQQINQPTLQVPENSVNVHHQDTESNLDVGNLENAMHELQAKNEDDPEMEKIDIVLEKILDIQHPERVKDKLKAKSLQQREAVFPVLKVTDVATSSLLSKDTAKEVTSVFYGLNDHSETQEDQNAIAAVIHQTQTVVTGATVKLRLLDDVYINGQLIPKANPLFGLASVEGERLNIEIKTIRFNKSVYPVKLKLYDLDGIPGIHVPGAITRDVAKQSTDNGLQALQLNTLNPSIGAQAASAGIDAAKSLISKKVKLIKVTAKAGHRVLLMNE